MPPTPHGVANYLASFVNMLREHGGEAMANARESRSPLWARDYASGRSGKGGVADSTGNVAAGRLSRDRDDLYDRMAAALVDVERTVSEAFGVFNQASYVIDPAEAKRKLRPAGSGDCVACGCWVTGQDNDRIKSGLCPKDYTAFGRKKREGMTRSEFITWRRSQSDDE